MRVKQVATLEPRPRRGRLEFCSCRQPDLDDCTVLSQKPVKLTRKVQCEQLEVWTARGFRTYRKFGNGRRTWWQVLSKCS